MEQQQFEFTRYGVILPEDDYDEDDEMDDRIEEAERRKKRHITRGNFFGT